MRRREGGTRGGGRRPDGGDISRRMEGQISSCTLWQFTEQAVATNSVLHTESETVHFRFPLH